MASLVEKTDWNVGSSLPGRLLVPVSDHFDVIQRESVPNGANSRAWLLKEFNKTRNGSGQL